MLHPAGAIAACGKIARFRTAVAFVIDIAALDKLADERVQIGRFVLDEAALAQFALQIGSQLARTGREPCDICHCELFQPRAIKRLCAAASAPGCCAFIIHRPYYCHSPLRLGNMGERAEFWFARQIMQ